MGRTVVLKTNSTRRSDPLCCGLSTSSRSRSWTIGESGFHVSIVAIDYTLQISGFVETKRGTYGFVCWVAKNAGYALELRMQDENEKYKLPIGPGRCHPVSINGTVRTFVQCMSSKTPTQSFACACVFSASCCSRRFRAR